MESILFSKIKVVYATFLFSFSIWLILIFIYGFPSINGALQVEILSPALLTFLVGSAIVASVSCLLIGLHMFGLKTETKKKVTEEKDSSINDLNLPTEEIRTNTLNIEDDSATEPEKTRKKPIIPHA